MKVVTQPWGALNAAAQRERRWFLRIEPNPGTAADDWYILSHGDITITSAGDVLDARIEVAKVASQRINPDQGLSTIGSMSFDILDVDGSFTTAMRSALLTDGNGLRGKRCEVWSGFSELADTEYVLEDTQVIESIKYKMGHIWSVNCRDIQREMRKTIFDPVVMHLTQPLSATATTIEVDSAALLEAVEHGTSYTDAASATVAYVRIDDEIIRVPTAGIGSTQLTSCVRGVLGTRAAEHTTDENAGSLRGKEVTEVFYLELPVPKLAYALLTGVLLNQSGTLPDHWHLGIDASDFVRTSDFQNIGVDLYDFADDTAGVKERYIFGSSTDGKRFIEKEILRKYSLFTVVHNDGEIGLRRGQPVLSGSAVVGELNDRFLIGDVSLSFDMAKIINDIEIAWNFIDDEPTRRLRIEDAQSIAIWGRAPLLEVDARGLTGSVHTDSRVRDLYESLRDRYSGPPIIGAVTVQASANLYEVGDVVRVNTTHVKDFTNTVVDTLDRAFEIQGVTKDLMSGRVRYDLFGSSQKAGPLPPLESTTPLPDAYYTAAGTDIAGLAGVVDGGSELVLPDALVLTGNADVTNSAAIYYATKNVRIPSGRTVFYTENVQLRIRGTFTVEGDYSGEGRGRAGVADTFDVTDFTATYNPPLGPDDVTLQGGTPGYFGSTQADGGIFDRVSQRSGSSSRYRVKIQSLPAPITQGEVEAIPSLNIQWDGSTLSGIPTDLRGTSGGPGGIRYWEDYADAAVDFNRGGDGGDGGAGSLIICRGMAFGASGRLVTGGDDGLAGAYDGGDERPAWSGGGAGGAPGATIIVLDGAAVATPVLTNGNVIADYGATPPPSGAFNQLPEGYINHQDTRFGAPTVSRAFVREDRFSFFTSAASGREAGIAAARYFFLLPNVAPEEDTDDVSLAEQQDISLGIAEQYGNRFDPLVTLLVATITENATTDAYSHSNIYTKIDSDSVWVFQGPAEPTLAFELPADGNTYDIKAVPVLTNGVEAPAGEEVGQLVSDGAGVDAVVWNNNIAGQVFESDDFGDGDLTLWQARWSEIVSAGADQSAQAISGVVGGYAWQIGNNSGNDQIWRGIDRRRARPLVSGRLYRISAWVRRTAGNGTIYIGVYGFKGDVRSGGGAAVNFSGTDSLSSQHYYGANSYDPGDTSWHFVEGYFRKGQAAAYRLGTQEDPHICHPDVEYVSPMFIGNYPDTEPGTFQLAFVGLDEMDIGAATPDVGSNLILDPTFSLQYQDRGVTLSSGPAPSADFRYWGATASTWGLNATAGEHGGVCATLAANVNGTLIASRFVPASNAERFFMSLRVIFGTGYNGSLAVNMYVYNASRSLVATVTMNNIAGPTTGVWVSANYSGVIASTTARFVRFALVASGGTAGTIAVQNLQASRQPFATSTDDPTVSIVVAPTNQAWVHTGSGWSPADGSGTVDLDITFVARRGSTVIATLVLRGVLDDAGGGGGGEGDITVSTFSGGTGWTIDYASTNGTPFVVATATHTASGVAAGGVWSSSLPGESGVSK